VRRLALATGAAAAVTAAVVASSVLSGGHPGIHDSTTARHGAPPRNGAIDTRTFLLASADTVARQPATHGTCWYSRTRTWYSIRSVTVKPGKPGSLASGADHTHQAQAAHSAENWSCTRPGTTLMRFTGKITDREGRPGVANTDRNTRVRLTVDQTTAQLLD
jgi:hypothetical protein